MSAVAVVGLKRGGRQRLARMQKLPVIAVPI